MRKHCSSELRSDRKRNKTECKVQKYFRILHSYFCFLDISAFLKISAFCILISAFLFSCSNKLKVPEIKVALASDFFPFAYVENDTLKGLEIELLNLLEKNLKVPIIISQYSFGQLLETFHNEEYDFAIGAITITEQREDIFDFSIPYYDATQTFLAVETADINIEELSDVTRYTIGVMNNTTSILLLENTLLRDRSLPANNLRRYNSLPTLISALKNNEVALIMLEKSIADIACEMNNFKIAYTHNETELYALVFKLGTQSSRLQQNDIKNHLNRALQEVLQSKEWIEAKRVVSIEL